MIWIMNRTSIFFSQQFLLIPAGLVLEFKIWSCMEAESYNWYHFLVNLWQAELCLWDKENIEFKCQSVHWDIVFLPLTTSITSEVKNNHAHVTTHYDTKNSKQIHWNQIFCRMSSLTVMFSISRRTASKNINEKSFIYWHLRT